MVVLLKPILRALVVLMAIAQLVYAQEPVAPLVEFPQPPVDIQFNVKEAPQIGKELEITVSVISEADINAEITCLLPDGIEIIRQKGLIVMPYRERGLSPAQGSRRAYSRMLRLWIGPLKAAIPQESLFRVVIPQKSTYEFIARVAGLGQWGVKEKTYTITVY